MGACCGGVAPMAHELLAGLEYIRLAIGEPVYVSSGFRCYSWEEYRGRDGTSMHCLGWAADVYCLGAPLDVLSDLAYHVPRFRNGGIGLYDTWIHVDIRPDGPTFWDRRTMQSS